MKICITGAAGYIGSILTPALLQAGHQIIALDNFIYGQVSLLDCCFDKRLTIIRGDARDHQLVQNAIKGCDLILPLACLTGAPICAKDPLGAQEINFDAVKMLLELRETGQWIIFPTTNSGYGIGQKGIFCTEETPMNPVSLYGRLKVEIEKLILAAGNSITLRLATVFGISPRMRLDLLVNDFTYRAVNDGFLVLFESQAKRNYVHIRDIARAFIHCIENFEKMKGEPYNVGLSDANVSKWELCEEIKKQVSNFYFTEAEIGEDPDKRDYIVSNEKIERTGFKASISLQQGITELIKGYNVIHQQQYSNI